MPPPATPVVEGVITAMVVVTNSKMQYFAVFLSTSACFFVFSFILFHYVVTSLQCFCTYPYCNVSGLLAVLLLIN